MKRIAFAVPGDLATPSGGYAYDRRLIAGLRGLGWQVDVRSLGEGFPRPSAEQRAEALSRLLALPEGIAVVVDGLALGALPAEAKVVAQQRPLVGLVHHPLALETGLSPADAARLFESERAALAATATVIVTSRFTLRRLAEDYRVPASAITVAPPGTERAARAGRARRTTHRDVRLLSVGAVSPRKGFDILIAALAPLVQRPWRLDIAGDLVRDPACAATLRSGIQRYGLASRIVLLGAVPKERLAALYLAADIFVLASHFEGYGMAYAEAMAHGLPIIATTGGAIIETVPEDAGLFVAPGDAGALTRALITLMENEQERRRLGAAALAASARLPTWEDTARIVAAALGALA